MRAVVMITSGANRVDQTKAETALGVKLGRADADWVRQVTGFAIGGVAPVGHASLPMLLLDEDLMALDPIWAAAGSPHHVFQTSAAELVRLPERRWRRYGWTRSTRPWNWAKARARWLMTYLSAEVSSPNVTVWPAGTNMGS